MKIKFPVLDLLLSLQRNEISRGEINQLIELSCSFAVVYLKYRYRNLNKVLLSEDITLREMAIEAVAPLFERDQEYKFVKISKSFSGWTPEINTEETAAFFLNRLVGKSVEKYVSNLLRESDPFFSKILDSVNYLISKNNFVKKQILGTTYIVEEGATLSLKNLPDNEFISDLPVELFNDNSTVLQKIFSYIRNNSDKIPAIPLNSLCFKLKEINIAENHTTDIDSGRNKSEVDSILDNACHLTLERMHETYLKKNKIDMNESEGIKKALQKIISDLKKGSLNYSLHKYFLDEFPELKFEDYKKRYQNMFEYLFKVMRNNIASQLKE